MSVTPRGYGHEFVEVWISTYSELSREIEQLPRQVSLSAAVDPPARKEEEKQNPEQRQKRGPSPRLDPKLVQFVADRLRKLSRPRKRHSSMTLSLACAPTAPNSSAR